MLKEKANNQVAQLIITGDQLREKLVIASDVEKKLTNQINRLETKSVDLEKNKEYE